MSSVSSVSGNNLFAWLQQIAAQGQGQISATTTTPASATPTTTTIPDFDGDTDGSTASGSTQETSGHHHHHHGGGGGGSHGISSQLESAITSALGSASSTGASGTTAASDPNQIIQTAIENFLKAATQGGTSTTSQGVSDPTTSGTPTSATATSTDPSGTATASDPTSQQAAFAQLLKSNGIDPKQFRQDLQTALQESQSQGGTIDFSTVFQNFPPGTTLDTTA
jgi:hypothetical protein